MVAANPILFKTAADLTAETGVVTKKGEHPDHIVVIKHVPAVGDSSKYPSIPLVLLLTVSRESHR
jgi:myo-inositol-1-phosphate synthase